MRFHTTIWLSNATDSLSVHLVIQRIERALWNTEDALDEWRNHARDLEAKNEAWAAHERELVALVNAHAKRINGNLLPRIAKLEKSEAALVDRINKDLLPRQQHLKKREAELLSWGNTLVDRINTDLPLQAALKKREAELLVWGNTLATRINDKLIPEARDLRARLAEQQGKVAKDAPRIVHLEAREVELVDMVNAYAKRINDDLIPKVTKLQEGRKAMQEEAARAVEREKALEARVATLAEENERLRAELAAATHDLADADEAGRALRDEVDSLERDAHERQTLPS